MSALTSVILPSIYCQIDLLAKMFIHFLFKILQGLQIVYRKNSWNLKHAILVQVHWKTEPETKTFMHMVNLESDSQEHEPSRGIDDFWYFWVEALKN